jgi:hypothetical protein
MTPRKRGGPALAHLEEMRALYRAIICDDISEIAVGTLITERPPHRTTRIGHSRGRPAAQGFGKCGAMTRHSVSVKSVWYRVTVRICFCRVVGVHMANPSWSKKPLGITAPMTQPFLKTAADKSPGGG